MRAPGLHALQGAVAQLAVVLVPVDAEIDVPFDGVGASLANQGLNDGDDSGDFLGCPGVVVGA